MLSLRLPRLLQEIPIAKGDGRDPKFMASWAKTELLVRDDWGLAVLREEHRRDVLELLEDRHGRRATLVTSQLPGEHWHEALGDPTFADAILDRLVHNAYKLALKGDSMRKRLAIHPTDVPQEEPSPRGRFDTAHHGAPDTGEDTHRAKPSQAQTATGHALGRHP